MFTYHRQISIHISPGSLYQSLKRVGKVRSTLLRHLSKQLFIAGEGQKLDRQKYASLKLSFHKLLENASFRHLRLWLNCNTMLHQTFICFCLNEAKRLCLNHCSRLLGDVEC